MAASFNPVLLLSFCQLLSASAVPQLQQVTVHPGDTVVLPCEVPNNVNIGAVEWTRSDLQKYVYFQRGRHPLTQDQDPSFVDRVQLKGEMADGDLSLILKKVNSNDNGRYECRYKEKGGGRTKRAAINSEPINIFELNVEGQTAGNTNGGHLGIILPVTVLIVLVVLAAVVGFVTFKKCKGRLEKNSDWSDDDPDTLQHLQENENSQSKSITPNTTDMRV